MAAMKNSKVVLGQPGRQYAEFEVAYRPAPDDWPLARDKDEVYLRVHLRPDDSDAVVQDIVSVHLQGLSRFAERLAESLGENYPGAAFVAAEHKFKVMMRGYPPGNYTFDIELDPSIPDPMNNELGGYDPAHARVWLDRDSLSKVISEIEAVVAENVRV